jgi:hypothetical protein
LTIRSSSVKKLVAPRPRLPAREETMLMQKNPIADRVIVSAFAA